MKQKSSRSAVSETARSPAVSRYVNRSATLVVNIDERFSGSMTAYVQRPKSVDRDFTSARPSAASDNTGAFIHAAVRAACQPDPPDLRAVDGCQVQASSMLRYSPFGSVWN